MRTLSRPPRQPLAGSATADALQVEHVYLGHPSSRNGDIVLAVRDIDFTVRQGEFVVIVGPSGCGKTTLLEALAGLVPVYDGTIRLAGNVLKGPGTDRSLVFQNASLFPWRNVVENVEFSLQAQRRLTPQGRARARELLRLVGLDSAEKKFPHELSGGMKQRVNLARALVTAPSLLLLDEPFGALDAQTREVMQNELVRVWQAEGAAEKRTAVFVTHDVAEARLPGRPGAGLLAGPGPHPGRHPDRRPPATTRGVEAIRRVHRDRRPDPDRPVRLPEVPDSAETEEP